MKQARTGRESWLAIPNIASQILNLILSSVKPEDTAETAGLSSTFEQLGNAIGVALVGTRTGAEFRENIHASQVKLSADEVTYINGLG